MIWDLGSRVWGTGFRLSWLEGALNMAFRTLNPSSYAFRLRVWGFGDLYNSVYCGGPKVRPTLNYKQKW